MTLIFKIYINAINTEKRILVAKSTTLTTFFTAKRIASSYGSCPIGGNMNYAAAASGTVESSPRVPHHGDVSMTKPAHTDASRLEIPQQRSPEDTGSGRNEHVVRKEHRPNTEAEGELVYVLTFQLTESLAKPMNSMRERHFPKQLNRTPAHLTLFHALLHSQIAGIEGALSRVSADTKPFFISSGKPFRMRLGIGINVGKGFNRMKQVHEDLRSQWMPHLSEQDKGRWTPHWTIMNKVNEEKKVNEAFQAVEEKIVQNVLEGQAVGLDLWRYDRGAWILAKEYKFTG
ncbi:uncharacterized protein RAG0_03789 [Rhynchosporium agropyri]|uniref:Uncharacterized protein n=1 Tax=Rhynchosporium agropyri TaxID=914238 RepID=A0A1E1K604_9HELO|nr:uncharacterized protein RAG0_03789 [Rhynchosporium agropyri]